MSEPPAFQNNAITRNRMSGVSASRAGGNPGFAKGLDACVRGAHATALIGPARVEKWLM
jgi:hypothetical protein